MEMLDLRNTDDRMEDLLKVYFIMGSINCLKDPRDVLREAIEGGITLFQFREKGMGSLVGEEKYQLARSLQEICKRSGIPFIVNDDVELALSLDADGIHIGQEDEAVEKVRGKIGDKILGVSAHTLEEARLAIKQGADYLGIGPIFPTNTKEDAKKAQGITLLKDLRENGIHIPLVGIGGIDSLNARSVIKAGADGVSVITAISHSDFPATSAAALKTAVD
jgi:thiamine-phosphate pyrophosphorylase